MHVLIEAHTIIRLHIIIVEEEQYIFSISIIFTQPALASCNLHATCMLDLHLDHLAGTDGQVGTYIAIASYRLISHAALKAQTWTFHCMSVGLAQDHFQGTICTVAAFVCYAISRVHVYRSPSSKP